MMILVYGTKYSRMDKLKFAEESKVCGRQPLKNFFHWILCPIYSFVQISSSHISELQPFLCLSSFFQSTSHQNLILRTLLTPTACWSSGLAKLIFEIFLISSPRFSQKLIFSLVMPSIMLSSLSLEVVLIAHVVNYRCSSCAW